MSLVGDLGEVALAVTVGYLVGTAPTAHLVTRIVTRGQLDIRRVGSGNPGGLNTMRAVGTRWGALVVLGDLGKGALACVLGARIGGDAGIYAAAPAAVLGHVFPVWARFRGGKGVATAAGSLLVMGPLVLAVAAFGAALAAIPRRDPARLARVAVVTWIVAAALWWATAAPELWGPEPAVGLVGASLVGGALVLWRFGAVGGRR